MDHGEGSSAGSGGSSVLKIVGDLAKGSKMPTVRILKFKKDFPVLARTFDSPNLLCLET